MEGSEALLLIFEAQRKLNMKINKPIVDTH